MGKIKETKMHRSFMDFVKIKQSKNIYPLGAAAPIPGTIVGSIFTGWTCCTHGLGDILVSPVL
jgi:hypothetical protein